MNIVITMAGLGERFKKVGYKEPKYRVKVCGKTIFEWSMDSLIGYNKYVSKYIFVVRKEDNTKEFINEKMKKYKINDIKIIEIEQLTDGQATTCMLAIPYCNLQDPIMIYNIDTYVEPNEMQFKDISGDGHIPCFHADGDHWSFVKLDEKGKAIEVREKERISDNCTIGLYYFKSCRLYKELYDEYYSDNNNLVKNEKYIAPLYNHMLEKNMDVYIMDLPKNTVHVLGTPEEVEVFKNN